MKRLLFLLAILPMICWATSDSAHNVDEPIEHFTLSNKTKALLFFQMQCKTNIQINLQAAANRQDSPMPSAPKLLTCGWSGIVKPGENKADLGRLCDIDLRVSIDLEKWLAFKYRSGFFAVYQDEQGKLVGCRTLNDDNEFLELEASTPLRTVPDDFQTRLKKSMLSSDKKNE